MGVGEALEPDEIVAAFRLLGGLYRRAVFELDATTLRTFFLARAEQLIHLPEADALDVLAAEVVQQVRESRQLLNDLRSVGRPRRERTPRVRLYRSHVSLDRERITPPDPLQFDP